MPVISIFLNSDTTMFVAHNKIYNVKSRYISLRHVSALKDGGVRRGVLYLTGRGVPQDMGRKFHRSTGRSLMYI